MNWVEGMQNAINYIETNMLEEMDRKEIAKQACVSSFYFQKAFSMLCGYTVGEYIRLRRLALAGTEIASSTERIIDIAMKYGYDSPDSFTKAFARFHGITPTAVRRDGKTVKMFAPLKIKFTLEGGLIMDYKIVKKASFTLIGVSKQFNMDCSYKEIPEFWEAHYKTDKCKVVCGMYGVCLEVKQDEKEFKYLIADNYIPWNDIPEGFETVTIPEGTWAVFPCKGPMPTALQEVNTKVYSEWLPSCADYEIAGGFNIELYSNPNDYEKGNQDPEFYSEIWIPINKK